MSTNDESFVEGSQKERRKRLRTIIASLRARVEDVCASFQHFSDAAKSFSDLAKEIQELIAKPGVPELVPPSALSRLHDSAQWLEDASNRMREATDVCSRVRRALTYAEKAISPSLWNPALVLAGVVMAGIAVAAAVMLPNGVTIIVENEDCATISIPGVANLVPGIDFPGEIATGDTGRIRLPRAFVGRLGIEGSEVTLEAFGRHLSIPGFDIDLGSSTWDGTSLVDLEGERVSVSEEAEHWLGLSCR